MFDGDQYVSPLAFSRRLRVEDFARVYQIGKNNSHKLTDAPNLSLEQRSKRDFLHWIIPFIQKLA